MIRRVLIAAALGAALLVPTAPAGEAHSGGSFCHGIFSPTAFGPIRPDGTQLGSGTGECIAEFQGFPAGVIGHYEAGDATAPAEIHVEVWATLTTGARLKLAECEESGVGEVGCELEVDPTGTATGLPEPVPAAVAWIDCASHSHANIKVGTAPVASFGCYTTDEAEAQLRQDLGV